MRDENGEAVHGSDLLGLRYILFFYPAGGDGESAEEALGFGAVFPRLALRNIYAFGVSADPPEEHARFRSALGVRGKFLTDEGGALAAEVDASRTTFLIGRDGRVEERWDGFAVRGHAKRVAEAALLRFRDDAPPDYRGRYRQYMTVPWRQAPSGAAGWDPGFTVMTCGKPSRTTGPKSVSALSPQRPTSTEEHPRTRPLRSFSGIAWTSILPFSVSAMAISAGPVLSAIWAIASA